MVAVRHAVVLLVAVWAQYGLAEAQRGPRLQRHSAVDIPAAPPYQNHTDGTDKTSPASLQRPHDPAKRRAQSVPPAADAGIANNNSTDASSKEPAGQSRGSNGPKKAEQEVTVASTDDTGSSPNSPDAHVYTGDEQDGFLTPLGRIAQNSGVPDDDPPDDGTVIGSNLPQDKGQVADPDDGDFDGLDAPVQTKTRTPWSYTGPEDDQDPTEWLSETASTWLAPESTTSIIGMSDSGKVGNGSRPADATTAYNTSYTDWSKAATSRPTTAALAPTLDTATVLRTVSGPLSTPQPTPSLSPSIGLQRLSSNSSRKTSYTVYQGHTYPLDPGTIGVHTVTYMGEGPPANPIGGSYLPTSVAAATGDDEFWGAWQTFLTINASWVTNPAPDILACASTYGRTSTTIYTTVFTSTVTYTGAMAQYTPMPTSLPPDSLITPPPAPVTATASTTLVNIPLGATVINGTYNLCVSGRNSMTASMVHCWGLGVVPLQTTCYSQAPGQRTQMHIGDMSTSRWTTTVVVTAKVPTVVLPPQATPDYGEPGGDDSGLPTTYVNHITAPVLATPISTPYYPTPTSSGVSNANGVGHVAGNGAGSGDPSQNGNGHGNGNGNVENGARPSKSDAAVTPAPVAIVFEPTAVVIDGHTFADTPAVPGVAGVGMQQQVVTVGPNVFTISPDQITGMGTTMDRPAWVSGGEGGSDGAGSRGEGGGNGVYAQSPATGVLGGLAVTVSGADVFIDGTQFALPAQPSTAIVHGGQTVYLGPDGVAAAGQTLHVSPVIVTAGPGSGGGSGGAGNGPGGGPMSEVIVAGGSILTVGRDSVIVGSNTIAYGNGNSNGNSNGNRNGNGGPATMVTTIAGDVVTIMSAAGIVIVHGTTLVAPPAGTTHYELVGGATFTEVGSSVVVLNGHSYTLGPAPGGPPGRTPGGAAGGRESNAPLVTPITTVAGGETIVVGPGGVTVGSLTFAYPFVPTVTFTPRETATGGRGPVPQETDGPRTHASGAGSAETAGDSGDAATPTSKNAASAQVVGTRTLAWATTAWSLLATLFALVRFV